MKGIQILECSLPKLVKVVASLVEKRRQGKLKQKGEETTCELGDAELSPANNHEKGDPEMNPEIIAEIIPEMAQSYYTKASLLKLQGQLTEVFRAN